MHINDTVCPPAFSNGEVEPVWFVLVLLLFVCFIFLYLFFFASAVCLCYFSSFLLFCFFVVCFFFVLRCLLFFSLILFDLHYGWYYDLYKHSRVYILCCHYNTSERGKTLSYNGLRQLRLISFQWTSESESCLWISDVEFHCKLFAFCIECCQNFWPMKSWSVYSIQPTW